MNKEEKRTSDKWMQEKPGLVVYDPDGWNRKNYQYSFYEEEITWEEFNKRVLMSTCLINKAFKIEQ